MVWQDGALALGGGIIAAVAIVHGILMQRHMVRPMKAVMEKDDRMSPTLRLLSDLLLHFTTFAWFLGGLTLIAAAIWAAPDVKFALAIFIGIQCLYGAVANLWATRGRHPGGLLMSAAILLIGAALAFPATH